jgi:hypothetical protein
MLDSKLIIHSSGTVDTIEFLRESRIYHEDLDIKVNRAVEEFKKWGKYPDLGMIQCPQCGIRIPKGSKFCLECGKSIQSPTLLPHIKIYLKVNSLPHGKYTRNLSVFFHFYYSVCDLFFLNFLLLPTV